MTFSGAFEYLHTRDGAGGKETFTHVSKSQSSHDQSTGARVPSSRTEQSIEGALDPVTEQDLQEQGAAQIEEGEYQFLTEESYGVEPGDIIRAPDGREFRVVQQMNTSPLVRERMKTTTDIVSFQMQLTEAAGS